MSKYKTSGSNPNNNQDKSHSSLDSAKSQAATSSNTGAGMTWVSDECGNTVAVYENGRRVDD